MEKVMNLIIQQTEMLIQRVNKLEFVTETYHEYKDEKESFIKYLNRKKLSSLIKTEMAIVHVTTNNKRFLSLQEAIKEQETVEKKVK